MSGLLDGKEEEVVLTPYPVPGLVRGMVQLEYRCNDEGWWCQEEGDSKGLVSGCSLDVRRAASVRRRILTCFAPGQAPHQSRVSGCRCWHTS